MNKNNFYFMIIYFLTLLINCQNISDSTAGSNNSNSTYLWSSSDSYKEYYFSEYKLINYDNGWGKGNITNYTQSILYNNDNNFGWKWDWPNVQGLFGTKAFPEVLYGQSPWGGISTTSNLPELVSNSNFTLEVTTHQNITGQYNTIFSIWLTDSPDNNDPSHIKAEIRIWLNKANFNTYGVYVIIDGKPYKTNCSNINAGSLTWASVSYEIYKMTSSTSLDLSIFLNDSIKRGYIQNSWYISDIEFGNEVIYGIGETDITHYKIIKH